VAVHELSVGQLQTMGRLRTRVVLGTGLALAVVAGLAVAVLGPNREAAVIAALLWMPLPLLFWRLPATAVLVPAVLALVAEQFANGIADQLTERLQLFRTLNTSVGLSGVVVSPAEIILGTAALTLLVRGMARRDIRLPRSALSRGLAALMLALLLAGLRGKAAGGQFQIIVDEVRPFLYVGALYLMATQAITTRRQLWALLWVDILATGFKGLQGTYRYIVMQGVSPPPESLLAHDESVFFNLFILLTAALWLFGIRGRLRVVATALLPFVLTADLANQRRAAWVIFAVGIVLLLVSSWVAVPGRRRVVLAVAVSLTVGSAAYLPVFWNSSGTLAQPARALRSGFDPNLRDDSSDIYRLVERTDLGIDIRGSTPLGYGFGRPIPTPLPLPYDATETDPLINYVPHNSILYIWLRSGVVGALAFWFVIGTAIVAALRVTRSGDRCLSLIGAFALWTVAAYVLEGWYDQGLSQYRAGVVVGCVLGCLEVARRLQRAGTQAPGQADDPR
jgi:O-Antigen ligase